MGKETLNAREATANPINAISNGDSRSRTISRHEEYMGWDEAVEHIKRITGVSDEDAEVMYDAIDYYTGMGYEWLREFQQGKRHGDPNLRNADKYLERFIELAPKWKGMTYRGMGMFKEDVDAFSIGQTIDMNGTSSWTSSNKEAFEYAIARRSLRGGRVGVIFMSKNQPLGTSVDFAAGMDEKEVTVSKRAKWRITGKRQTDRVIFVSVEPI